MVPYVYTNINLGPISSSDLFKLLDIIILNKNVNTIGTEICFELFERLSEIIIEANLQETNSSCDQLVKYVAELKKQNKFDINLFWKLFFAKSYGENEIPLNKIAWLDLNKIISFEQYCIDKSPSIILSQIIATIKSNENKNFPAICHLISKILLGSNISGCTKNGKLYSLQCRKIIDDFIELGLEEICSDSGDNLCFDILPLLGQLEPLFYESVLKQFYQQIIQKLLVWKNRVKMTDAQLFQHLWCTINISENVSKLYFELMKYYSLEEFSEMIHEIPDRYLNWKYVLILIGCYVVNTKNAHKQIKDYTYKRLVTFFSKDHVSFSTVDDNFKVSKELLSVFLIIRQSCLEQKDPHEAYSEWYSSTFGPDSILRTGSDAGSFSFLMVSLSKQICREPTYVLRTHIQRSIRTPAGCQNEMHVYKDVCRVQLARLLESPEITLKNDVKIPVLSVLEDALNNSPECVWALRQQPIRDLLLLYIEKDDKYNILKEMLPKTV